MKNDIMIIDVVNNLNKLVEPLKGKKINDFKIDLHDCVNQLVFEYCNELGLNIGTWNVSGNDKYMYLPVGNTTINYNDLFCYDIPNFKEDERVKYGRKGILEKVVFNYSHPGQAIDNMLLSEYIKKLKVVYYEKRINSLELWNIECYKSIEENNNNILLLKAELNNIL